MSLREIYIEARDLVIAEIIENEFPIIDYLYAFSDFVQNGAIITEDGKIYNDNFNWILRGVNNWDHELVTLTSEELEDLYETVLCAGL